ETEVIEIAAIEAGEHSHREDLEIALLLRRGLHDALVAMHGDERDAAAAQVRHRPRDRLRDVVHLEIGKHLVAALDEPFHELEIAGGHEELEPHLVEARRGAEPLDQRTRFGSARHIERDDQPFSAWNRAHWLTP